MIKWCFYLENQSSCKTIELANVFKPFLPSLLVGYLSNLGNWSKSFLYTSLGCVETLIAPLIATDSKLIIDNCGEAEIRSYLNQASKPTGSEGSSLKPQQHCDVFLFIYELSESITFTKYKNLWDTFYGNFQKNNEIFNVIYFSQNINFMNIYRK